MVDVPKQYVVPKALSTAHRNLMRNHTALEKEFDRLRDDRFDLAAHRDYLRKIRAHLEALHKHTGDLLREGERLHDERLIFHASHVGTSLHDSPRPRPLRKRPAPKR